MTDLDLNFPAIPEEAELAHLSDAIFDQYDEETNGLAANDEGYENLYPSLIL